MREIKFRAWDKKKKKMLGSDYPNNWNNDKEEYWYDWEWLELTLIESFNKKEGYEVMQYTGLKDKNSKEIYEGDIVKHKDGVDLISWDTDGYFVGTWTPGNLGEWNEYIEVVGNKFETPNLIKQ